MMVFRFLNYIKLILLRLLKIPSNEFPRNFVYYVWEKKNKCTRIPIHIYVRIRLPVTKNRERELNFWALAIGGVYATCIGISCVQTRALACSLHIPILCVYIYVGRYLYMYYFIKKKLLFELVNSFWYIVFGKTSRRAVHGHVRTGLDCY